MVELKDRHTALNLKSEVEKLLDEFEIEKKQIYSITTDNGRNLIKTVELLNCGFSSDYEQDNRREEGVVNLLENITFEGIASIRCAAHTLQLAVSDVFKDGAISGIISKARDLAKLLRTPSNRSILASLKKNVPTLDVPTRWNSSYLMLIKVFGLKNFCEEYLESQHLTNSQWLAIQDIANALCPIYNTTLALQKEQLLLGDFFKLWLEQKLELKAITGETAKTIREKLLVKNITMSAAMYLDPRFRRILNSRQKQLAKMHLKKIAFQLWSCKMDDNTNEYPIKTTEESDASSIRPSTLLDSYIQDLEAESSSEDDAISISVADKELKAA